jgi:hypothetical protein
MSFMKLWISLPLAMSVAPLSAATVTVTAESPYTTNFDDFIEGNDPDADPGTFTETNSSANANSSIVQVPSQGLGLRQTATSTSNTIATVDATGLTGATGNQFSVSTTFVIDSFSTAGIANTSLNAAASSTFASGYRISYTLASTTPGAIGGLTLSENATTIAGATTTGTTYTPAAGAVLTLTLTGIYSSATSVSLAGYLFDSGGNEVARVTFTDTSAQTGNFFGVRTAVNGGTESVTFTNFTLAVPEPASAALAIISAAGLSFRRKRC